MFDIASFRSWALGDLADNANRGIFAEWLVGQLLDVIDESEARREWTSFDLRYGEAKVEIKTTGLGQTWKRHERSKRPTFDIAPRKSAWDAETDEWVKFDPPERPADLYVFCLHEPVPATSDNVRDPAFWNFWVILTETLDNELGSQKTVGLSTLSRLAPVVGWLDLRAEVDRCLTREAMTGPR